MKQEVTYYIDVDKDSDYIEDLPDVGAIHSLEEAAKELKSAKQIFPEFANYLRIRMETVTTETILLP